MNTIRDLQHQKENVDAPFNISQRKSQPLGPTQSKFPNSSKKSATPGSIKKNRRALGDISNTQKSSFHGSNSATKSAFPVKKDRSSSSTTKKRPSEVSLECKIKSPVLKKSLLDPLLHNDLEIEHAFGGISEDANDDYMKHVKKKIAEELMAKSNCKSLLDDFDPWKCPVETLSPLSDTPHFNDNFESERDDLDKIEHPELEPIDDLEVLPHPPDHPDDLALCGIEDKVEQENI